MKKFLLGIMFSTIVFAWSGSITVQAEVEISVSLPAPIVFAAPPEMIVFPGTDIYVVPDVDADIFFYEGWWWRPWHGRWYRSHSYNSDWGYYPNVPVFFVEIPSGWRNDYREHRWHGQAWNYQRVPHQQVQANWNTWKKDKHWEKQNTGGGQGLKSRPQLREAQPQRASHEPRAIQPVQGVHAARESKPAQTNKPAQKAQSVHRQQPIRNVQPTHKEQAPPENKSVHASQPEPVAQPGREAQPARNEQPPSGPNPSGESHEQRGRK